jgi:hypothetical protein
VSERSDGSRRRAGKQRVEVAADRRGRGQGGHGQCRDAAPNGSARLMLMAGSIRRSCGGRAQRSATCAARMPRGRPSLNPRRAQLAVRPGHPPGRHRPLARPRGTPHRSVHREQPRVGVWALSGSEGGLECARTLRPAGHPATWRADSRLTLIRFAIFSTRSTAASSVSCSPPAGPRRHHPHNRAAHRQPARPRQAAKGQPETQHSCRSRRRPKGSLAPSGTTVQKASKYSVFRPSLQPRISHAP